ncbi:MAG TPA: patatin-like phospholipase family protein [Rhodospirillales bacterium]|nr:patatin-like phospholipase family protein [Rhodospirillales bacterium]
MTEQDQSPRRFDLGLVMAGAASAGAFTAGVVDFLIDALQAWAEAKAIGDPTVPDHDVQIRVAAGTSAGGIVAALLAMLPFTGHYPMRDLATATAAADAENAERNLLYRCWVVETDVHRLLANDDLHEPGARVPSLLNGSGLAQIADEAVADVRAALAFGSPPPPAFFANPLQLYLCFTNMRGVPYVIRMTADESHRGHLVTCHSDYAHFAVLGAGAAAAGPVPRGAIPVNWPGTAGVPIADGWDSVRDASLATSAFPCGFPARPFRNPLSVYRARDWIGSAAASAGAALGVEIDLPEPDADTYDFWCVDGGLLNNEPLEYVRSALMADAAPNQADDGRLADRSLLLIDPFPDDGGRSGLPRGDAPDVIDALFALIPVLRAQAAFKPQELMRALDENLRSRYLLSPKRRTTRPEEGDLATGGLAGFAGFVHARLRMHDYQLGRRNCQKFLADHFHVHIDNPIVRGWTGRLSGRAALEVYHPTTRDADGRLGKRRDLVQIIPLMPAVRAEVPRLPWPKLSWKNDFQPVRALIERRADIVVPELVRALLVRAGVGDRRLINRALRAIASDMITRKVGQSLSDAIEQDLVRRGLL